MGINIDKLEKDVSSLAAGKTKDSFVFDLLLAYGIPKTSVTRLKKGDYNLLKGKGEILWKKKLFFKHDESTDLHILIDMKKNDPSITKHHPRFILVTDNKTILAIDTKTGDTLDIPFKDLGKHYNFFLPWAGMEKSQLQAENPADIKAAEKMGRLYDLILEDNKIENEEKKHALNVFLSRLLFCFFAEDTNIFKSGQFTNTLASNTAEDGSDLHKYLHKIFQVLNVESRKDLPKFLEDFPYVNGGLFQKNYPIPFFSTKSRKIIIECGSLNWAAINPDIFGSMIQAVVHTSQRGNLGMHYTSVANIRKVIEPLFLNDLHSEFEKAGDNVKKLEKLLTRLYGLQIFDPACGSGNFLIIAYKELCKLEILIFKKLQKGQRSFRFMENIKLSQFFGIEIDDFAHETAKLSLWLAEHQMNLAFEQVFTQVRPTLPLQEGGNIVCGNATKLNWSNICPKRQDCEIYILGNPPYLGARNQSKSQKEDIKETLGGIKGYNNIDYIACWFMKASKYIENSSSKFAFVSTNSISQGTQVALLWPYLLKNLEIFFAHQSFKWTNNAKGNAGVTCVIIGLCKKSNKSKHIYIDSIQHEVPHINAYLLNSNDNYIENRRKPISNLPSINYGSFALDDGHYTLTKTEAEDIIKNEKKALLYIRKFTGAKELIQGNERFCIWIDEGDIEAAQSIKILQEKIEKVRIWRSNSSRNATKKLAATAYRFAEIRQPSERYIAFPTVSSERRDYIPISILEPEIIASNQIYIIANFNTYDFAIFSSRMHMTWVRTVAGRLESRIRYSSALCYNTFPFPEISETQKEALEECVFKVLDEREAHSEKTMAELYDPDKMPDGLRQAHHEMDLAIEQCYRKKPFKSDDERLEYLFKLYEEMIAAEKKRGA